MKGLEKVIILKVGLSVFFDYSCVFSPSLTWTVRSMLYICNIF